MDNINKVQFDTEPILTSLTKVNPNNIPKYIRFITKPDGTFIQEVEYINIGGNNCPTCYSVSKVRPMSGQMR